MKLLACALMAAVAAGQSPSKSRSASTTVVIRGGGSYLGIAFVDIDSERAKALKLGEIRGVEVKVVDEGSPAAKAGLKPEDVVTDFNGQRVDGVEQFIRLVRETPAGRKIALSLVRAGAPLTITAVLETRVNMHVPFDVLPPLPPMPPSVIMPDLPRAAMFWHTGRLGIESESLNPQMAEYFGVKAGVLVRMVSRQSPAEKAGMHAGDVIVRAGGKPVSSTQEVTGMLRDRKTIALLVVRNRKEVTLDVTLDGSSW